MLIAVDDRGAREEYAKHLAGCGFRTETAHGIDDAAGSLREQPVAVCVATTPQRLDGGLEFNRILAEASRNPAATHFVVLAPQGQAVPMNEAANPRVDTFPGRPTVEQLAALVRSATLRSQLQQQYDSQKTRLHRWISRELVGNTPAMQELRQRLADTAKSTSHVVLRGEAGAGLTAAAHVIHAIDSRTNAGLIAVDCRITSAETFQRDVLGGGNGHTVAFTTECGVSAAGTIVLDHADVASLALQDRIVSLLKNSRSDIRLLVCTNSDMRDLMRAGRFRDDLYHNLGQNVIHVPALRERRADIGALAERFLSRVATRGGQAPKQLSVDALELLEEYDWPRNLRELSQLIEQVCSVEQNAELTAAELRPWMATDVEIQSTGGVGMSLRAMERKLIESTFARFRGNREQTARQLQIGLRTLSGKLREYGYPPRGGPGSNVRTEQRKAA